MTTRSGFTKSEWMNLKLLFNRKVAFNVSAKERATVRDSVLAVKNHANGIDRNIKVIPVSTMEWASTTYSKGGKKVALVDVEQANAISFLLAKSQLLERPIFSYVEFMIRGAETLYSSGNEGASLLVAKRANTALRKYAILHGDLPFIHRPMYADMKTMNALISGVTLTFVTAHEVGHLLRREAGNKTKIEEWIIEEYRKNEFEEGKFIKARHERFLKPETIQKFDDKGKFCGDISLAAKLMEGFDVQKSLLIGEAHSDVFGLIAATDIAIKSNISQSRLLSILLDILEHSEMLMSFKRLIPRLPVKGSRSNVAFEATSLGFRKFMFIKSIEAMRGESLPVSKKVSDYWRGLEMLEFEELKSLNDSGKFLGVSNRSVHIARAALLTVSSGNMPKAPTEEEVIERYGVMSGAQFFLMSCLHIPESWIKIEKTFSWVPDENSDPVPMGYGAAIYDIAKIIRKPNLVQSAKKLIDRTDDLSDQLMLGIIRHPRSQVSSRKLIPKWPHDIMRQV